VFDIGFAELIIIAVVGLLVIGPDKLPGAIRTGSLWLGRIKRGFNDIRREVEQELHNDAVMQELKQSGEQLKSEAAAVSNDLQSAVDKADQALTSGPEEPPHNKPPQPSP
jgi:sec-independent protein translocase protein TatB